MPLLFYRCAKCGREHPRYEEAELCEKTHLEVLSARVIRYSAHPYPHTIEVTFSDGSTKIYRWEDLP